MEKSDDAADTPTHAQVERGNEAVFRGLLWFAALVVSLWGMIQAKEFLIPVIIAALIAMLMAPCVRLFRRLRLPEWAALSISALILFLPLLGLASLLAIEAEGLIKNWPSISTSAQQSLESAASAPWLQKFHLGGLSSIGAIESKLSARAGEGAVFLFAGLKTLVSAGTTTLLVLGLALLMLASRIHLRTSFEKILAVEESPERARMLEGALGVLEKFLLARVLIIIFVAAADFVILKLFGVSYAVTLSVILGLSTMIPVVGFFIGIIPPIIVAASGGERGLILLGIFAALWGVSSVQDHLLTPKLIGQKLNLNFFFTTLAVFAGERMWGLSGMFLSIPILGLIRVLLNSSDDLKPWALLLAENEHEVRKMDKEVKERAGDSREPAPSGEPQLT